MKLFFASAVVAGGMLLLGASPDPLPVDYNGVRALVAQIFTSLKS